MCCSPTRIPFKTRYRYFNTSKYIITIFLFFLVMVKNVLYLCLCFVLVSCFSPFNTVYVVWYWCNIQMNAINARRPRGCGEDHFHAKNPKSSRFCNRINHTVDFCHQKHCYPNINKQQSRVNAVSQEDSDANNSSTPIFMPNLCFI